MDKIKGIRKRGNTYQAIVSKHHKQFSATCATVEEAIAWREAKLKELDDTNSTAESGKSITLIKAVNMTISAKWEGTKGEQTATINAHCLVKFFGPLMKIEAIDTEQVNGFIEAEKLKGAANSTINKKLSALSMVLKTAAECGYATANPKILRRKEYKGRERFLTDAEEQNIISLLTQWEKSAHLDAFYIMLDGGLRISECLGLKTSDIDFTQGKHGVMLVWETKNNHPRGVPLSERLATVLKARIERNKFKADDALFPDCTQDWFRATWDRVRYVMGLADDVQFVPHILRHTCASRLVQKGVPLIMVQRWLGHNSIQSTMRYAHLAPTVLYEYVD